MANIQVVGLKDNGDGTGQLEAAQTATSDTYAFPNYTGYIKAAGTSAATASSTIPNTDVSGLGTMSTQAASSVAITGGTINGATVGATTAATGRFTTVESTVATGTAPFTVASTTNVANLNASSLNGATFASPGAIGSGTSGSGAFTTLSASSTVSGTGFSNYLASPPAIGSTVANTGAFTTLSASSTVSGTGFSNYLASPPAIGGTAAAAGTFTQLTVNGSNVTTSISPTGTGTVTISPAGALTVNPTAASTINNASIGATTASTGRFTSVETTTGGVGAGTTPVSGAWVKAAAGTATVAPVLLTSGTNLSSATAGAIEYDGKVTYATVNSTTPMRGAILATQFARTTATYNTTGFAANTLYTLFGNLSANGAITVAPNTTYIFECGYGITGMSATAGRHGFGFLTGTATISVISYVGSGGKGNTGSTQQGSVTTITYISSSNTNTTGSGFVRGLIVIGNTGGTIIPAIGQEAAGAAAMTIASGSYFMLQPIASDTTIITGTWT